jgi:hypothetical protein
VEGLRSGINLILMDTQLTPSRLKLPPIRVLKHLGERFQRPDARGVFAHEVSIPKA